MRIIDNKLYYTAGDIAVICNRTLQTVNNWDKYSNQLEAKGEKRLIPKPIRINNRRLYTEEQKDKILEFSQNIKRGQMAEWSRSKCGIRGKEIQARIDKRREEKERRGRDMLMGLSNVNRGSIKKMIEYLKV